MKSKDGGSRARDGGMEEGRGRVIGADLSLNHGAIVVLDGMKVVEAIYVTTRKAAVDRSDERFNGVLLKLPKASRKVIDHFRLIWWGRFLLSTLKDRTERYMGLEDYAFAARSSSAYQYGELGGLARWCARGFKLRLHDPMSVKLFTTGRGDTKPADVERAVRKRWGQDFRRYNGSASGANPVSEDLAVAYAIARMVMVERRLRQGKTTLDQLKEHQIRVFNRVTKANPENLLARPWLEGSR